MTHGLGNGVAWADVGGDYADEYRSLFENAVEGIYRTTTSGRYMAANAALARIYGYDSPQELIKGLTDIAHGLYVDPEDRERFKDALSASDVVYNFEARVHRRDGSVIWISENARAVRDRHGNVLCYEGTVQDITERKSAEARLRLAGAVFDNVGEAIVVLDPDDVIQAVNGAFERMTGWAAADVVGKPCPLVAMEMHDRSMLDSIRQVALSGENWSGELWARRRDGDVFPAHVALTAVPTEAGGKNFVMLCRDITRPKMDEQRIRFHASHDALTRLVNRFTVLENLKEAVERASHSGNQVVVVFIDLNRFKDVNDSFGHAAGDDLLRQAAARLRNAIRLSDVVGRLGGDEFVVILPEVQTRRAGLALVDKLRYVFSEPFRIKGRDLYISTSVGIAVYPSDGDNAETLLSAADTAMYHAKAQGRSYLFYDHEMSRQAAERVNLENDLRVAIETGQFRLHYQPKVDAFARRVVGGEALIRWRHPARGEVSPALFIPVAEQAGLIGAIGDWALTEACSQMARWRARGLNLPTLSVNLSPAQFHDARLRQKVEAALAAANLEPQALELEITETMMATEVDRAISILAELGAMGVQVSIDDFGTGYSSLGYLKLFDVDALKIDRAFVKELPGNGKDGAIIASVMALAHNLGFEVIAEGVETEEQAQFLMDKGCRVMQGFLYSRPVPPDEFAELLANGV